MNLKIEIIYVPIYNSILLTLNPNSTDFSQNHLVITLFIDTEGSILKSRERKML